MNRLARSAIALAAAVACGAAHADPVFLGGLAVSLIGDAAATWLVQNALTIALTSFSLGSAALQRRKQRKQAAAARAAALASLSDRTTNIIDTESPPQIVYGSPAPVGCSIPAFLTSGDYDDLNHLVCIFAAHPCEAIDEIYIDGVPVGTLGADGWAAGTNGGFVDRSDDKTGTFDLSFDASGKAVLTAIEVVEVFAVDGGAVSFVVNNGSTELTGAPSTDTSISCRYRTVVAYVNIQKHLSPGGVDTADTYLMAQCPTQWTADHKLSGYTYAVVTLSLAFSRFQGGRPQITAKLRGKNTVYDFRTGTAGYSRNPALCLADYIRSEVGYQSTVDQMDTASIIAAANACDVEAYATSNWAYDLYNFGGSPALYVCDGSFRTDQDRETIRQQFEDTMCGNSHQSGGVWRIMAGAWSTPVMSLTDDDLVGSVEVKQGSNPTNARYNGARVTYVNAAGLGTSSDEITPYVNASYLAEDGRAKMQDIQLAFVGSWVRASQVARVRTAVSRAGMTILVRPKMKAWCLQPGDRIQQTSGLYQFTNKNFRLSDWSHATTSPVAFELVEDEPGLYAPFDGQGDPAPNSTFTDPFAAPSKPEITSILSGTSQLLYQSGSVIVRVRVDWHQATEIYVLSGGRVELDWRPVFATEADWKSSSHAGDASSAYWIGVPEAAQALFRVRFVSAAGTPGPYAVALHTVLGKTEPPPQVSGVALAIDRVFFDQLDPVAVPDLSGYLVRVVSGTSPVWSLGVPLHEGVVTDSPWLLQTRLYGVQTVMVAAVDDSGNVGVPGSATLDFGQPDVSTAIQQRDIGAAGWPEVIYNDPLVPGRYAYDLGEVRRFARGSAASYVTSAGTIALAGSDVLRLDYTGRMTAAASGAKNFLYRSNEFENAAWNGYYTKPASSLVAAPDGTMTARRMASADAGPGPAYSGLFMVRAIPNGAYTVSVWLRATAGTLAMALGMSDGAVNGIVIDTTWRRYTQSFANYVGSAGGNRIFQVLEAAAGNAPWEIWHAQVNAGLAAVDYIASDSDAVGVAYPLAVFENPQLLIEAAAANAWPYSTRLSDQWVMGNSLITFVEGVASPDGGSTATRLIAQASNGYHYADRNQWGAGLQTWSVFVKSAGLRTVGLNGYSTATAAQSYALFDLVTGTISGQFGAMLVAAGMQPLANGWWRIYLTIDNGAGSNASGPLMRLTIRDPATDLFTGDGYSGVDVWGFNLVAGALSSYVHQPATAGRAADSAGVNSIADSISYNWQVVDGAVAAMPDGAADFWSLGEDFWIRDGAADVWGGSSYLPLAYTGTFVAAYGGGTVLLEAPTTGSRTTIDYRVDGGVRGDFWLGADGEAAADFWGAAGDFWGGVNAWQPWLGQVTSVRGLPLQFRVSIDGGPLQGVISSMRMSLVMPLVDQVFGPRAVAAGGSRLDPAAGSPPRRWISITSATPTPVADGSGAVTSRVKDFDPVLGAQIELLNAAGVAVTGTATAIQHGYEDATA